MRSFSTNHIIPVSDVHSIGVGPDFSIKSPYKGQNPLNNLWNRRLKRVFDVIVSSAGLLFFPVILIPVAVAIKMTSRGPVFYRQLRTGYRGRRFICYKFRTMHINVSDAPVERSDPRVTSIGRFLRRTSMDELPQIINVFLGHMSLVGPRPHMVTHTIFYGGLIDSYMARLNVKPGITGWAQINGYRGATDRLWKMERRIEHDIWYIRNWSMSMDIKIIFRTFTNILKGEENAY